MYPTEVKVKGESGYLPNEKMSNKEKAGDSDPCDTEPQSMHRPDSETSPALGDKCMAGMTGDPMDTDMPYDRILPSTSNTALHKNEIGIKRQILCDLLKPVKAESKTDEDKINECIRLFNIDTSSAVAEDNTNALKTKLLLFKKEFLKRYTQNCKHNYGRFLTRYKSWLEEEFVFKVISTEVPKKKQKTKEWSELGKTSKYEKIKILSESQKKEPKEKFLAATTKTLKSSPSTRIAATILKKSLKSPSRISSLLKRKPCFHRKSTPQEALGLLLDTGMSKSVYIKVKKFATYLGFNMLPDYQKVRLEKNKCRPPKELISVDEIRASVKMQHLLNHTAERLCLSNKDPIIHNMQQQKVDECTIKLICSTGFDGSSNQSPYKMVYTSHNASAAQDSSLFATTLTPLQIVHETDSKLIFWHNKAPHSYRSCRPLKIEFVKEKNDVIKNEYDGLMLQIRELEDFLIKIDDYTIKVKFSVHLTVIDGKVLSVICGASSTQACPLCKAGSKEFNNLQNIGSNVFSPTPDSIFYGISPLHAWIRCMEFCLHLSYRLELKKWRASKAEILERKTAIQTNLFNIMGLRVDIPKPGGSGNSNDGNTARRAFKDFDLFADILGLDSRLVKDLRTILITINCQLPIDPEKFGIFCSKLAEYYVGKYNWYRMPVTMHKILIHGEDIVRNSILPVGMLGEEGGESRNKFYRRDRDNHARKTSRIDNLTDVFCRALDTSDPIMCEVSLKARADIRAKIPLPPEVLELLMPPSIQTELIPPSTELFVNDFENLDTIDCEVFDFLESISIEDDEEYNDNE